MKFFNTAGKTNPVDHYFLPKRLDWDQLTDYIEKKYYFLLHAPRQSGKTSAFIEFVNHLNQVGKYTALYVSFESTRSASNANDVPRTIQHILNLFKTQIEIYLPEEKEAVEYLHTILRDPILKEQQIHNFLHFWAARSKKPLVLFLDEFDVLTGDSLVTVLSQFRTGYSNRPEHFPQTICLIGVRDLREYKIKTQAQEDMGVLISPFNIKAESLILPDFTPEQVRDLYLQHTQETGQKFTDEAIDYAFEQTQGQPWLVNALAYQACFRDVKDRSITITKDALICAREELIKRQDTHIDALVDRLNDERVYKIMDAIISGQESIPRIKNDDLKYVQDLGLVKRSELEIANPIYQEIIPRALTESLQMSIAHKGIWYQNPDGSLNMKLFMEAFTQFFRENSEMWLAEMNYKESCPHLVLFAFLQRIINGGGRVIREYALGMKRVDLLVLWKTQRIVMELKILHDLKTLPDGLTQTRVYMDKGNASEGHLLIFDRTPKKTWEEKIYHRQEVVDGKTIEIWNM